MMVRIGSARLAVVAIALLALFFGVPGFSQSSPQQSPQRPQSPEKSQSAPPKQNVSQTNTLRVTSRLVQVSVIARDQDGNLVTGLTKDDFVILDQGQRQNIARFTDQSSRLITTSAEVPPNVFTNRVVQPPLTVIVIDVYNARWWDEHWCPPPSGMGGCAVAPIFSEVQDFIRHMQPQDRVALYVLDGVGLFFIQDFTSDPNTLQRAFTVASDRVPGGIPRAQSDHMYVYTMEDMQPIADRLASVPGRKNLIWLGPGFPPAEFRETTFDKIDKTARKLGNADLPLFPINKQVAAMGSGGECDGCPVPGGMQRGPISGVDTPTPALLDGNYGVAGTSGRSPLGTFGYIKELAELSGGHAARSIRSVIDESTSAYLLGYYPDHNKWNGDFREIKVKVNRPGVEIQARRGYYAIATAVPAPKTDKQALAEAIHSPLESTDLNLDVQADAVNIPGGRQLKLLISFNPTQLHFEQQGTRWTDNVVEEWAQFDAKGRQVGTHSQTLHLKPLRENYEAFLQRPFSFSETVPLADGAEEVRLVVRDTGNGAIGSVIIPLAKLFAQSAGETPRRR